jgi:hypothetical protein
MRLMIKMGTQTGGNLGRAPDSRSMTPTENAGQFFGKRP